MSKVNSKLSISAKKWSESQWIQWFEWLDAMAETETRLKKLGVKTNAVARTGSALYKEAKKTYPRGPPPK